jgi:predicted nucleic-acid-binding protein
MVAVDTNVLVRMLVDEDPNQSKTCQKLFETHEVFIPDTVLLETEWILRSVFGLNRLAVCGLIRKICGLPNVMLRDSQLISGAIDLHEKGIDFADALHLTSSRNAAAFKTFDADFIRKAKKLSDQIVEKP